MLRQKGKRHKYAWYAYHFEFEEVKGKTTVTSTSTFPTESAAQQAIDMGVETGMNSTLNQLEKLLNQK